MVSKKVYQYLLLLLVAGATVQTVSAYHRWGWRGGRWGGWGWRRPYWGWGGYPYSPYYDPYYPGVVVGTGLAAAAASGGSTRSYERGYRDAQLRSLQSEREQLAQENERLRIET